ncbi:MAG TPA: 30S ribosomal protein S6 [Lachnospiraceae bacterium]|jgi:small subunit ribosomal protein S6|nr:30S ribosomal protein S6 [Lachnospiraceae bacterium]
MNKYEVALVLSSTLTDEQRQAELDLVKEYIAKYTGVVTDVDDWGKRKLAYEIHKQSEGYFCFIKADGEPSLAVELEKELRLRNETLLRYLIVRQGE